MIILDYLRASRVLKDTQRLQRAVNYAVTEAEHTYKQGQNEEKYKFARDFLTQAGYKLSDSEARMWIEAEVYRQRLANGKAQKEYKALKEARKTPAQTAEEFSAKYQSRRFTPASAGKAYLLTFLFDAYQRNEHKTLTSLWNLPALKEKIETEEDMRLFDAYYHLTEYLRSAFETAVTMRNALRSAISELTHTVTSIISAENIRQNIKGEQDSALSLWLSTLTIEAYTPQRNGGILIQSLRENIGQDIRYLIAYHTFLDIISEFTGIPECSFLKVLVGPVNDSIDTLNEALECLRDEIKQFRESEIRETALQNKLEELRENVGLQPEASAPPTGEKKEPNSTIPEIDLFLDSPEDFPPLSITRWTPEYLKETMKAFEPIGAEPPVPEAKIQAVKDTLRREFSSGILNWYVLFTRYSLSYRIPAPAVTPPCPKFRMKKREGE